MGEVLRDYQREMLGRINEAWKSCRSVMVQMPTGTGKTVLMSEVIRSERLKVKGEKCRILVVAHRRELIEQIQDQIKRTEEQDFEIIRTEEQKVLDRRTEEQKNKDRRTEEQVVYVESIQKLARAKEGDPLFAINFSLIIVDEAHHAVAKTYRTLWEMWPEAKFLGLTATPCRLSGEGFGELFDVLLQSEDIQWFIDKGWLSDFEYVSARPDSLMMHQIGGLQKRGADGDYQTKEMATVMDVPESIAHLYDSYEAFAQGKKGIVYAINQEHARHIAAYYQSKGVNCAVIDSTTPTKERDAIVEAYKTSLWGQAPKQSATWGLAPEVSRKGQVDVIVNVDIFSEGFDCPEVEFIQLARPTLSLNKYLQQVGRGMRGLAPDVRRKVGWKGSDWGGDACLRETYGPEVGNDEEAGEPGDGEDQASWGATRGAGGVYARRQVWCDDGWKGDLSGGVRAYQVVGCALLRDGHVSLLYI